jgi:hypothetical protein
MQISFLRRAVDATNHDSRAVVLYHGNSVAGKICTMDRLWMHRLLLTWLISTQRICLSVDVLDNVANAADLLVL